MTPGAWIALASLALLLVVNLAAVVYWGGQMRSELRTLSGEIPALRTFRHDAQTRLGRAETRLDEHERRIYRLEEKDR